ncbi:hypothetical protein BDM02DRAFT_352315 [Thelephora ganbajun]|uniref:Uncharacterized protein n=1 Tax=Thelephora ganbajun TaxID=370292 RepID=A0ACB6ZRK5_THEGA|nr:hypothetical protein BDM02DRAFT_352315 [Thelephora ganbajun]
MADQDFFSTNVSASNPKPGHTPESTDSFAKAIQSRFSSSSLILPPSLHLPSTSGSKKKPNKHGFSLSMPAPALSLPTPVPVASSSASSSTIPTHSPSSSQLLCSSHPPSDLDQFINDPECLILDIRSHAAFTTSRLANALSLSVPSTLLKRPLYSLEKLTLMLSSKSARTRFSAWAEASSILVYDADSFHIPEGSNLYGLLKKLRSEGYPSEKHLAWLKGGFISVWRERKNLVVSGPDKAQVEEDEEEEDTLEPLSPSQSTGLLRTSALPSSAFNLSSTTFHRPSRAPQHSPTQPTSLLPPARIHSSTAKSAPQSPPPQSQAVAFNPFYDTVRQNLELPQGIPERIPLTLPASVRERIADLPFRWLRHIARRAAPASRDYTPLECSAENTEGDTSSSSLCSSSSSAGDSDAGTTPPLSSSDAARPHQNLVEEGTEALAMQFYRIELGEQRRLMGVMQHHSSESGRVLTSSSGSPSSEENFEAPVPRVRHPKCRLNRTEVSFPYSITAGVEKGAKNR